MIRYLTTILLSFTLLIGEIHSFLERPSEYRKVNNVDVFYEKVDGEWQVAKESNWIINGYEPMTLQWNLKFLFDEINVILYFVAAWFFGKYPNRVNKASVAVFVQVSIIDMVLYFWDFKRHDYHLVYFCIGITFLWKFRKELKQRLIG